MNLTLLPLPALIAGQRVHLRPWRRGDGAALWARVDAERARLGRFLPWPAWHTCPEDSEEYVRRASAEWVLRTQMSLGLFLPDGTLVGGGGLPRPDWELRSFEVGYWVAEPWEGCGIVAESVQLLTAMAFDRLDARRVHIRCEPANHRSSAVPRRLGFLYEGTLRQTLKGIDGASTDVEHHALLREEYYDLAWAPDASAIVHAADSDG